MRHEQNTFRTSDGLTLYIQHWWPEHPPRALIVLLHGYGEHSGRHAPTAEALARSGYAVVSWDARGHGRSAGHRGYVQRFDHYVGDALSIIQHAHTRVASAPLYLLGHSMGGTIAVLLALSGKLPLAGLVTSAAALAPGEDIPPLMVRLAPLLGTLAPHLPTVKINSRSISRDPAIVTTYDNDPLTYRGAAPAGFAAEFLRGILQAQAGIPRLHLPLLVLYGGQDQLINPEGSRRLYDGAASADKTTYCYAPCYHEILNEPERSQVLADILDWLDARTVSAPSRVSEPGTVAVPVAS
jgi:acylglycerol lipase